MPMTRRIFISMPADRWLAPGQNDLKWGIVEEIEELGYTTEIFFDPRGRPSLAGSKAWTAGEADTVLRRCIGAAVVGMPRWSFSTPQGEAVRLPTEFCYYEGAVGHTLRLPMFVVVQADLRRRVVFDDSYGGYIGEFPQGADRSWLETAEFRVPFGYWRQQLAERRDVFLGYCGSSRSTADRLKRYLRTRLRVTVLDWNTDFTPGRSILEQIAEASSRCSAGIFLFTQDDKLTNRAHADKAVPRDNVVFEAGYFISAKGKDHVLIVREAGAKMPADLGGDIYALLQNRRNIESVEDPIRRFVSAL